MKKQDILLISHRGNGNGNISLEIPLLDGETTVNGIRSVIQAWASIYKIKESIAEIELQINGFAKITYGTIQTKRGLAGKDISWKELFKRGGKIFN